MFHSFVGGVSTVSVLQNFLHSSLFVLFTTCFALADILLYSIIFAIVGFRSIVFLARRLLAMIFEHSLVHHGLLYIVFWLPDVLPKVVSAALTRDRVKFLAAPSVESSPTCVVGMFFA